MDSFVNTREEILQINYQVSELIQKAESAIGRASPAFMQWSRSCTEIARQLMEHLVRVAVVGAIKSGKSTLVNALLQEDYLKRGAGVVTSMVTRIRRGDQLRARIFFKSWEEVNAEIQQALVLFPTEEWRSDRQRFDIRRPQDRRDLQNALDCLDQELRIAQDGLNANSVLLSSYLKGFDSIQAYLSAESSTRDFTGGQFGEHRTFVGNDALAVYLKDIQLEVTDGFLTRNSEVADCQGSDSPNPLHLAMIQDYLLKAHLIVYVISSRTGLRQADIRFLSIIKRMGVSGNILFVCNLDFNEHDSLPELHALVQRVREEVALIIEAPRLFSFSALFNLFKSVPAKLTPRDQERLEQWRKAPEFVLFSDQESQRLQDELQHKLTRERAALLLRNQVERIDVNATGLRQWLRLNRELLRQDADGAQKVTEQLQTRHLYMQQVQSMIQNTLTGAMQKISREQKMELDRFFDLHNGPVLKKTLTFVRDYNAPLSRYQDQLAAGFNHTLYLLFQEFKQALDSFMAEKINPEIMSFMLNQEKQMQGKLRLIIQPYEGMVRDALMQYENALQQFGLARPQFEWSLDVDPDLEAVKQRKGLQLPPASASMYYSAQIRTEAVLRLGFYASVRWVRKILKKPAGSEKAEELKALKIGVRKMKKETERSLLFHFTDYRENVKFQYMQRLVEAAGQWLFEKMTEQFSAYAGDVKEVALAINEKRSDKESLDRAMGEVEETLSGQQARLETVRQKVQMLMAPADF